MQGKKNRDEIIHIKKYGNRRLYSSAETRFITVEEIADIVRRGRKVRVTDADTDEDITAEMLTQILLENGRAQHFPVEMLEQMIRLNEEAVKGFWTAYLHQSLQMLQSFQNTFQSLMRVGGQSPVSTNPFMSFVSSASKAANAAREAVAPSRRAQKETATATRSLSRRRAKRSAK